MTAESRSRRERFEWSDPGIALDALLARIGPAGIEQVEWPAAPGRVLAQPVLADRDSPPCDVSSMDGYAVRIADLCRGRLEVGGDVPVGAPAASLPPGQALRIVTGAMVPPGAEAVLKREDVVEHSDHIIVPRESASARAGQYIRRAGENVKAGEPVISAGTRITPPVMAALAGFGCARVAVHRKVRVGVLVTGDELLPPESRPERWQIRDSNGPALRGLLAAFPWCDLAEYRHERDEADRIAGAMRELLRTCDAVLLTGGVSMGTRDCVASVVQAAGAGVVFHRLPIRPGKPILAAVGPEGQAILGLPGNPVSVLVTARRFGVPVLAKRAGLRDLAAPPTVEIAEGDEERLDLWWYRPVRRVGAGAAALVPNRGSGDYAAVAHSDGFVELPPGASAKGRRPFYRWDGE